METQLEELFASGSGTTSGTHLFLFWGGNGSGPWFCCVVFFIILIIIYFGGLLANVLQISGN